MGTPFTDVYECFLGKITDDMYVELTPQDTIRDLRHLLTTSVSGFEYPRKNLYDWTIEEEVKSEADLTDKDFSLGTIWEDIGEDDEHKPPRVAVEHSYFGATLTPEEIDILAILMMCAWLQRQITSIENIRMKYSGSDFKMTSQANHLAKLVALLGECQRQSHHLQRLYKRREIAENNIYRSTWYKFNTYD